MNSSCRYLPWRLRLVDSRYVQAWRQTLPPPNYQASDDPDIFYDAHERRPATLAAYDLDDDSLVLVTWNLSALGQKLYTRLRAAGE